MGELIVEVLVYLFIELLFQKILNPGFKYTGAVLRYLFYFGHVPFNEMLNRKFNAGLGFLIIGILIFLIIVAI